MRDRDNMTEQEMLEDDYRLVSWCLSFLLVASLLLVWVR